MQHIHHRIDPGHVQRQAADQVVRQTLEVFVGFLRLDSTRHESVEGLIGHGNRLVHAVHRARGVEDDGGVGGFLPTVGDGRCLVLSQEVFHQKPTVELAEQLGIRLADELQPGNTELPAHWAFQYDDVAQSELLAVTDQALHQERERPHLRDHQLRDLLPLDHAVYLLLIEEVERVDMGHRSTRHVEAVEREDNLCRRGADERHARTVISRDASAGKRLGIAFPITEHLAIRVRPIAVPYGHAVQALVAERVHLFDEGPAGLVKDGALFEFRHQIRPLFFTALHGWCHPFFTVYTGKSNYICLQNGVQYR